MNIEQTQALAMICHYAKEYLKDNKTMSQSVDIAKDIIEKELKDKEKTDKVLEIIKSCICDISISYYEHLDKCFISLNHYSREITKEEYDLLKEVLL